MSVISGSFSRLSLRVARSQRRDAIDVAQVMMTPHDDDSIELNLANGLPPNHKQPFKQSTLNRLGESFRKRIATEMNKTHYILVQSR